jgi:hypothetical protein
MAAVAPGMHVGLDVFMACTSCIYGRCWFVLSRIWQVHSQLIFVVVLYGDLTGADLARVQDQCELAPWLATSHDL